MSVLTRGYMLSEMLTTKLYNNSVITSFQPSTSNMYGDPILITVSSIKSTKCCVLRDIALSSFHNALIGDHNALKDYIVSNATEKYTLKPGSQEISVSASVQLSSDNLKRNTYSLVIGLVSGASDSSVEEIDISCYIIHVKIRKEENVDTSIMYTFWKTNWNRLLIPQILFDAGQDANNNNTEEQTVLPPMKTTDTLVVDNGDKDDHKTWRPCCFICLSSSSDSTSSSLRVLLPCRHAAVCHDCFQSLHNSAMSSAPHHLIGLLTCPLCRTPINSTLLLPVESTDCAATTTGNFGDDVATATSTPSTSSSSSSSNGGVRNRRHEILSY
ncbi:unnamed protein product [Trichobilharzia szidati]|nr:unnamed protein product [Trichobilharzia szidati]